MTEPLENLLRTTLREDADQVHPAGDLASAARARLHTQRRRRWQVAGSGLAVIAIIGGIGIANAMRDGTGRDPNRPAASASAPAAHPRSRGLEAVSWGWSDEQPPDPTSTTLQVGAYFMECASGQAPQHPEAVVRYSDRYVYIGVWAEPLEPGTYRCPMGGSTPLTITLDEPIGSRKLIKDIPTFRTFEAGSWELAEPVGPSSRTAVVLVGERGCEGVSPGAEVKYEIVPRDREVVLHVQVKPGPEHDWICGGRASAYRLTVDLGAPLGDRRLTHGEFEPAR